jgi:hypothetical protein
MLTELICLKQGPVACFCEHSNEFYGSIKCGIFLVISWVIISFRRILFYGVSFNCRGYLVEDDVEIWLLKANKDFAGVWGILCLLFVFSSECFQFLPYSFQFTIHNHPSHSVLNKNRQLLKKLWTFVVNGCWKSTCNSWCTVNSDCKVY